MKKVKKIFLWLVLIVFLLSMSMVGIGCKEEAAEEEAAEEEAAPAEEEAAPAEEVTEIYIIWDVDNLDESTNMGNEAMAKRVAEINEERDDIHITYEITDAQNIIENQLASLEAVLLKKPDVMVLTYTDAEAVKDAVKAVHDAGIKVIDLRDLGDLDIVDLVFYGYNEPEYARVMREWLLKYLDENPDVVLKAGLLYGGAVQTKQLARCDLVKDLAEEMPDRVEIVTEHFGDWDTAKA